MTARVHPPAPYPPVDPAACHASGFVAQVLDDALAQGARVYAVAGVQGSGKSTLAAQMAALGMQRGIDVTVLSIDDFYLDRPARQRLGREIHPLLATRGPPGTHDASLACEVLDRLRDHAPTRLPRFDKIADRRLSPSRWPVARDPGLIVLEGWFLKTPPQAEAELATPLNNLERHEDREGTWRAYCNEALGRDYAPLWSRLDRLLFLQPPGFDIVPGWRWQQEQALQAANPGRATMTRPEVERFVQLFERVTRHSLRTLPAIAERTVVLDASRRPRGDGA